MVQPSHQQRLKGPWLPSGIEGKRYPGCMFIIERESWVFCFYSEDFAVSVVVEYVFVGE
jgi:hypothetical protein